MSMATLCTRNTCCCRLIYDCFRTYVLGANARVSIHVLPRKSFACSLHCRCWDPSFFLSSTTYRYMDLDVHISMTSYKIRPDVPGCAPLKRILYYTCMITPKSIQGNTTSWTHWIRVGRPAEVERNAQLTQQIFNKKHMKQQT